MPARGRRSLCQLTLTDLDEVHPEMYATGESYPTLTDRLPFLTPETVTVHVPVPADPVDPDACWVTVALPDTFT